METVKDMGNPFLDQSEELLTLDIGKVLDKSVVETVYSIEALDTDVVVILIGKLFYFTTLNSAANIWVAFGAGKNYTYWHINTICHNLGEERSLALPFFTVLLDVILHQLFSERKKIGMGSMEMLSRSLQGLCFDCIESI